jgi:hypothetical protein
MGLIGRSWAASVGGVAGGEEQSGVSHGGSSWT